MLKHLLSEYQESNFSEEAQDLTVAELEFAIEAFDELIEFFKKQKEIAVRELEKRSEIQFRAAGGLSPLDVFGLQLLQNRRKQDVH